MTAGFPQGGLPQRPDRLRETWERAGKILSQEARTACADKTVMGGLEKFVSNWYSSISTMEAGHHTWQDARRVTALLRGYSGLSPEERALGVRGALAAVSEVTGRLDALSKREPVRSLEASQPAPSVALPQRGAVVGASPPASRSQAAPKPRTPARRSATPSILTQATSLGLDDPIVALKGIGKARASQLGKLGILRIRDLLLHFPRDYRDYRPVRRIADLMFGETASVLGVVADIHLSPGPRQLFRTTAKVKDDSGTVTATWFRYGYGGVKLSTGSDIVLAGTVAGYGSHIVLDGPDWEAASDRPLHTRRLVPVYPLTEGVGDYWLRELMAGVVPACAPRLDDPLPGWLVRQYGLLPLADAVAKVHFPDNLEEGERGRGRLAFDELLTLQLAALKRRLEWRAGADAHPLRLDAGLLAQFLSKQPFPLTGAQDRVVGEILGDISATMPMTRLLQGEVGSGKTIVAATALFAAIAGGYQAALMAPTEILAEQHARTLRATFQQADDLLVSLLGRPLRIELLTGAAKRSEREAAYRGAAEGAVDILIGTQALIQEGVGFRRLGLAVIDEQQRFGVAQRSALREKGGTPHLLVMTATPIPRTLALTLYGDLDLSIIDQMPPGRQKVQTHLLGPLERTLAYEHIRREAAQGRQAFIICPLVEDSPHLEVRAATAEYERLKEGELSGLRLALLHGKMRPAEKDRIMLQFRGGEYDVLVSTSVVEVGIDIPNATVVLIEGAERFGLAQLHQFRGRVGRGEHASSCVLLTDSQDAGVMERLGTVASISDGFRLAEEDLRLRGPGDYVGLRQSGFSILRMADLTNVGLVESARKAAGELLERDPGLVFPEHRLLADRLDELNRAGAS